MENPFEGLNYSKKERKLIPAGTYQGNLTGMKKFTFRDKKENKDKTKILFIFNIPATQSDVTTGYFPSLSSNSKFYGFVQMLTGGMAPASTWESYQNLWDQLRPLLGTTFTLQVAVNGEYNNIMAAIPMQLSVLSAIPAPVAAQEPPVFTAEDLDLDNIPF